MNLRLRTPQQCGRFPGHQILFDRQLALKRYGPRRLFSLTILTGMSLPVYESRLWPRTSIFCDPGMKASSPTSTSNPPLMRPITPCCHQAFAVGLLEVVPVTEALAFSCDSST